MSSPNPFAEDMGNSSQEPSPAGESALSSVDSPDASANESVAISYSPNSRESKFSSEQLGQNPYGMYIIDTKYDTHTGIIGLPVADGSGEQDIISVHDGKTTKIVKWSCERIGAKPILPHWDTGNDNEVCVRRPIQVCSTMLTIDSREVWRAEGCYVYELRKRVDEPDKFYCGAPPFSKAPSAIQVIGGESFSKDILRAA